LEKENEIINKEFHRKEEIYEAKIKELERQMLTAEKNDIFLLQKQNRDFESHIQQTNGLISQLDEKVNSEKTEFNTLSAEVLVTHVFYFLATKAATC
jgi:hypothetical protein